MSESYVCPRDCHSFPTRRSSDLAEELEHLGLDVGRAGLALDAFQLRREQAAGLGDGRGQNQAVAAPQDEVDDRQAGAAQREGRSEEHTSELQSRENLVCRLLLEK